MTRGKIVLVPFPFDDLATQKARPAVLIGGDRDPDVGDHTRTFQVRQHRGLTGNWPLAVIIARRIRMVARRAIGSEILETRQVRQVLRGERTGECGKKQKVGAHGLKYTTSSWPVQ